MIISSGCIGVNLAADFTRGIGRSVDIDVIVACLEFGYLRGRHRGRAADGRVWRQRRPVEQVDHHGASYTGRPNVDVRGGNADNITDR